MTTDGAKPMNDNVSSEVKRQQRALDQLPTDYAFPLFNAKQALESQRRSGYNSTASAAREIVDNSIEAGAARVDVVLHSDNSSRGPRTVSAIAFIDDGPGMLPQMARYALSWGGGTHFEEQDFIGKFGFGLPNASINQTRRVEVYTRINADDDWNRVVLDINDVSAFGIQQVGESEQASLPAFVETYLGRGEWDLGSGTVVVWDRPDRLSYKAVARLKEHLLHDFGVTYRYLLPSGGGDESHRGFDLRVESMQVRPVDPLFLLPGAAFYVPKEDGGTSPMVDDKILVRYVPDSVEGAGHLAAITDPQDLEGRLPPGAKVGTIRVRIVRFPLGFAVDKGRRKGDTTDAHRRHDIRKSNHGMSFVRSNREIATVTSYPRNPQDVANGLGRWPDLQAYTYHVGVEVSFESSLDDVFGITNDKQGVRPIEDFWRLLHEHGIDAAIARERQWQVTERKETRRIKIQPADNGAPTMAELAGRAADGAGRAPVVPDHHADEVENKVEEEAAGLVGRGAIDLDEARQIIREQQRRRPYRVSYVDKEYGPFYEPAFAGRQIQVKINKAHPFYKVLYMDLLEGDGVGRAKNGLDLLLLSLARAELTCDDPAMELWYKTQREQLWSPWLGTSLEALEQMSDPEDHPEVDVDSDEEADEGAPDVAATA